MARGVGATEMKGKRYSVFRHSHVLAYIGGHDVYRFRITAISRSSFVGFVPLEARRT